MEQHKSPPGFRFSPTDEELVMCYLKNRACGKYYHPGVIVEVEIYRHEPWELPEMSALPSLDPVWYFFNAQDKRHSHSSRVHRTTSKGYWKATGKDRRIYSGFHAVGIKKTLIYYDGRAPSGRRSDWVMHEYKLDEDYERKIKVTCSAVLCRIRKKGGPGPRNGEQFGAPVHEKQNEWAEDGDDTVFESGISLSPQHSEFTTASFQPNPGKAKVLGLDGHLPVESVGNNTDDDIFVESLFVENPYLTCLETDARSSAIDSTQGGQVNSECMIGHGPLTPWEEDNKGAIVHDYWQYFPSEEAILEELQHLAETGVAGSSTQAPLSNDGDPYAHLMDMRGDFIELIDIEFPLDHSGPSSSVDYGIKQQQLPSEIIDQEAKFGCPPVLLHTQGSAARRVRLKVIPKASAIETNLVSSEPMEKMLSKVPGSTGIKMQIDISGCYGSQPGESSVVSALDDTGIVEMSLPKRHSGKELQLMQKTDILKKLTVEPLTSDLLHFSPSLVSKTCCLKEEEFDCELAWEGEGLLHASTDAMLHGIHTQVEGFDCKADPFSRGGPKESSKPVCTSSKDYNKDVGELVNKVKAITLASHLVAIESNLSATFNDKVFALGKPVTQLFPANDYANPYRRLKSVLVGSVCRLCLAVLMLFFILIGIHVLTKYVSSPAA